MTKDQQIKKIEEILNNTVVLMPSQSELAKAGYGIYKEGEPCKFFNYEQYARQQIAENLYNNGCRIEVSK